MTPEDKTKVLLSIAKATQEERNAIIDTGFFNTAIDGYMTLTLVKLGHTEEEINEARVMLKAVLAEVDTATARQAVNTY